MKVEVPKGFKPIQHMGRTEALPSVGMLEAALVKEYLRQIVAAKTAPERPKIPSHRR